MLRLVSRGERLARAYTQVRGRRDSIEILASMLDILLELGEVSKTKLMNQANLNPLSFQRYISMLERAGVVERVEEEGRTVYRPTPRAPTLRLLLDVILSALSVEPGVLAAYHGLLQETEEALAAAGISYYRFSPEAPYADLVVECCGSQVPLILCVDGDTLAQVKAVLAKEAGADYVVVGDGRCSWDGSGRVVKPEELAERLSGCRC